MIKWTDEQLKAINESGKNIIVSAGAGSGKTAVLSERVITKLKSGININELLILTFTNAAALEMKERIRLEIRKNEDLKDQLELIDEAYITTFDSYSLSIVKKYHYLLNINKNISIIDSTISEVLKMKYLDLIFDEYYEKEDELFLEYIKTFTTKDDRNIKKALLNIFESSSLIYEQDLFLEEFANSFNNKDLVNSWISSYEEEIKKIVKELKDTTIEVSNYLEDKQLASLEEYSKVFLDDYNYENLYNNKNDKTFRIPPKLDEYPKSLITLHKDLTEELNKLLIYESLEDLKEALTFNNKYSHMLKDIILKLKYKLEDYKNKYNVYEFIDITRMSIKLVSEFEEVRSNLRDSYKEIMIDEYQDTNDLQEAFISNISNNNVYMVGDIKQSIYGFRNANMDIFKEKYDSFKDESLGIRIDLNKNFRSREESIKAINEIFNKVMTEDLGEADYINEHQMVFGNMMYEDIKHNQNYDLEILTYNEEDYEEYNSLEKETFIITNNIKNKVNNKYQIIDKESKTLRDVKYSDFTILIDRGTDFDTFKQVFEHEMIPLNVLKDEKLTESDEILIIKNILKALVYIKKNKLRDNVLKYSYVSIARSYLYNTHDEEIFINITQNKYLETEIIEKLKYILKQDLNISSMLELIYDEFDIYNKLLSAGFVERRHVALTYLIKLAKNLENLSYSLEDFTNYIEDAIENKIDITYNINEKSKDSVTIMTIHKSKGLEFPICYYPRLTKEYNLMELNDDYLYSKKFGIILPTYDDGIKQNPLKPLYRKEYINNEISESIRLLYVSLTRAKEKMIIVVPNKEKELKHIRSFFDILYNHLSHLNKYINEIDLNTIGLSKDYKDIKTTNYKNKIKTKNNFKELQFNINIEEEDTKSFSKKINKLITKKDYENIQLGLKIHDILENIDFHNINLDYVEDEYKHIVTSLLNNDIFKDLENKTIYKEYEFMFEDENIIYNGIIDLVIEDNDKIVIVDYKLSNIDDPDYVNQLTGYKNYMINKTNKEVEIYLYSILKNEFKKLT